MASKVHTHAIVNTIEEKISNVDPQYAGMKWEEMNKQNRKSYHSKQQKGHITANKNKQIGIAVIEQFV